MNKFGKDLQYGEEAERLCMEYFSKKNPGAKFDAGGKKKEYDFVMYPEDDSSILSYEVKRDRMAPRTGNIAIEILYKGNPSGLMATTADYIVYVIGERMYQIKPADLSDLIQNDKTGRSVNGGDNNDSLLWLMKVNVFTEAAEELV